MFDMASSIMMRRSSSTDSNSSTTSLSYSPKGWSPAKSTISPPAITSSPSSSMIEPVREIRQTNPNLRRALSPSSSRFAMSSAQQAYISSWPIRESLSPAATANSPTSCYFSPTYIPNSRISDDDLVALDFTKRAATVCQPDEAVLGLSWSAINNPNSEIVPALQICERRRRLPPPPVQYRRHSSSTRRSPSRKNQKPLGAIAE